MPDYSPAVDALVARLMREQGLDPNNEAAQASFRAETLDKINQYIISRIPDDKLDQFEELLAENNPEKISFFLEEVLGNLEKGEDESLYN